MKNRPNVQMAYARMNVAADRFLRDVIINAFFVDDSGEIPALTQPGSTELRRAIFRGSADSEYGKELRWSAETKLQPWLTEEAFSRNQLLNEGVEVFQNRTKTSTDILHEYFVPRDHVVQFHRAYPQGKEFFELKRKYDPTEIFQNQFYRKYGRTK